jgi:hypothetical protein
VKLFGLTVFDSSIKGDAILSRPYKMRFPMIVQAFGTLDHKIVLSFILLHAFLGLILWA